jgi:excisionase family DNA binding protein
MSETALLTPEEVAARLKVKPRTVQEWLRSGRLAGLKLGKLWRIREYDLEAFLDAHVTSGAGTVAERPPAVTPEERAARIRAARGSMAHVPGSVDDFLRRKHEDIVLEEHNRSLLGILKPHIQLPAAPEEEWDGLIGESIAEEWRQK